MQKRLLLFATLLIALFLRTHNLASAPPGLSGDEIFNAIDASKIGWGNFPVFLPGNNGRESLFFYLLALSTRLLGSSPLSLRLPAALLGTGSVLLAYCLGREGFPGARGRQQGHRIGLSAALLSAVSLWPIMGSRWALRAVSLTFMSSLTLLIYLRALHSGRWRDWLLAGLALGLTLYTYIPARAFPAVIILWFGWLWLWQRPRIHPHGRKLLASLLLALLVFAPFGLYMLQNPEAVNQRVGGLNSTLDNALRGDLAPLLRTVATTLRTFSIQGDTDWRYHLAPEPIFDPITAAFFYLGLALCLWFAISDIRPQKSHAHILAFPFLLLLWAAAMLAPNAILKGPPSFLRAAGAIVPLYTLTAIGLEAAYSQLRPRPAKIAARAAFALLILVTLGRTWHGYFNIWNNNPEVRDIYHAELAAMGRTLAAEPPASRTFVAYSYIIGNTTPTAFNHYTRQEVSWFDRDNSFAWPADTASLYLVPAHNRLPPAALAQLETAATSTQPVLFSNGDLAFTRYTLPQRAITWEPALPTMTPFVDGPTLLGYDLPAELYRGDTIPLLLHWQIPPNLGRLPNAETFIRIQIADNSGNIWAAEDELISYPQASWQAGDRFVQTLALPIPPGIPPGQIHLITDLRTADGQLYPLATADMDANRSPPIAIASRPLANFAITEEMAVFNSDLALTGSAFSTLIAPGIPLNLSLDWVALRAAPPNYRIQLSLVDGRTATPILTAPATPLSPAYPPAQWQQHEQVTTQHRLEIPLDLPTKIEPELHVALLPPSGQAAVPLTQGSGQLATLTLDLRPHRFELPTISQPLEDVVFGDSLRLLGYDLDSSAARPNGSLRLILYWQAIKTPAINYTVFTHLAAADGQLWGQLDSPPIGEAPQMKTWLPGEIVVDSRDIPIRPNAPTTALRLLVGLYSPNDIVRLPVTAAGQPADQIELTTITLSP